MTFLAALLFAVIAAVAGEEELLYLCGFRPFASCKFDSDSRCQAARVNDCAVFSADAFEEFGLTEVYALVSRTGSGASATYGYQIFRKEDCTGNPFGFAVKQDGMTVGSCQPLKLPFVDNQVDFAFYRSCQLCHSDGLSTLASNGNFTQPTTASPLPTEAPVVIAPSVVIDTPRVSGYLLSAEPLMSPLVGSPIAANAACHALGFSAGYPAGGVASVAVTTTGSLAADFAWVAEKLVRVPPAGFGYFSQLECEGAGPEAPLSVDNPTLFAQSGTFVHLDLNKTQVSRYTLTFPAPFDRPPTRVAVQPRARFITAEVVNITAIGCQVIITGLGLPGASSSVMMEWRASMSVPAATIITSTALTTLTGPVSDTTLSLGFPTNLYGAIIISFVRPTNMPGARIDAATLQLTSAATTVPISGDVTLTPFNNLAVAATCVHSMASFVAGISNSPQSFPPSETWNVPPWPATGVATKLQQSPDFADLLQVDPACQNESNTLLLAVLAWPDFAPYAPPVHQRFHTAAPSLPALARPTLTLSYLAPLIPEPPTVWLCTYPTQNACQLFKSGACLAARLEAIIDIDPVNMPQLQQWWPGVRQLVVTQRGHTFAISRPGPVYSGVGSKAAQTLLLQLATNSCPLLGPFVTITTACPTTAARCGPLPGQPATVERLAGQRFANTATTRTGSQFSWQIDQGDVANNISAGNVTGVLGTYLLPGGFGQFSDSFFDIPLTSAGPVFLLVQYACSADVATVALNVPIGGTSEGLFNPNISTWVLPCGSPRVYRWARSERMYTVSPSQLQDPALLMTIQAASLNMLLANITVTGNAALAQALVGDASPAGIACARIWDPVACVAQGCAFDSLLTKTCVAPSGNNGGGDVTVGVTPPCRSAINNPLLCHAYGMCDYDFETNECADILVERVAPLCAWLQVTGPADQPSWSGDYLAYPLLADDIWWWVPASGNVSAGPPAQQLVFVSNSAARFHALLALDPDSQDRGSVLALLGDRSFGRLLASGRVLAYTLVPLSLLSVGVVSWVRVADEVSIPGYFKFNCTCFPASNFAVTVTGASSGSYNVRIDVALGELAAKAQTAKQLFYRLATRVAGTESWTVNPSLFFFDPTVASINVPLQAGNSFEVTYQVSGPTCATHIAEYRLTTVDLLLSAPKGLSATVLPSGVVTLTWLPVPSPLVVGYHVRINSLGQTFRNVLVPVSQLAASAAALTPDCGALPNTVSTDIWGLPPATTFDVVIFTQADRSSESPGSASVRFTTPPHGVDQLPGPRDAAPVAGVNGTALNSTALIVTWSQSPLNSSMGIRSGYEVRVRCILALSVCASNNVRSIIVRNPLATSATFADLEPSATYEVTVRAAFTAAAPCTYTTVGCDAAAGTAWVFGASSTPLSSMWVDLPSQPPGFPLGLNVTVSTFGGQLGGIVAWLPPPVEQRYGPIISFLVSHFFKRQGNQRSFLSTTIRANALSSNATTTFVISPLDYFTDHCVAVIAVNLAGAGVPTPELCFQTPESTPAAPQAVRLAQSGSFSLLVTWDAPVPPNGVITAYTVVLSEVPTNVTNIVVAQLTLPGTARMLRLDGLAVGLVYGVVLRASTSAGGGDSSLRKIAVVVPSQGGSSAASSGLPTEAFLGIVIAVAALGLVFLLMFARRRMAAAEIMGYDKQLAALEAPRVDLDDLATLWIQAREELNTNFPEFPPLVTGALPAAHDLDMDVDDLSLGVALVSSQSRLAGGVRFYQAQYASTRAPLALRLADEDITTTRAVRYIAEQLLLHGLQHTHIVRALGLNLQQFPLYFGFELLAQGVLIDHLQSQFSQFTESDMLDACLQLGNALVYLESQHVVHRDIAARNVLVGEKGIYKLCNFAMLRDWQGLVESQSVRWMAPEVIQSSSQFSSASDAWSYGMLCWEICTHGQAPFGDVPPSSVLEMILSGERPPMPPGVASSLSRVIQGCGQTELFMRLNVGDALGILTAATKTV